MGVERRGPPRDRAVPDRRRTFRRRSRGPDPAAGLRAGVEGLGHGAHGLMARFHARLNQEFAGCRNRMNRVNLTRIEVLLILLLLAMLLGVFLRLASTRSLSNPVRRDVVQI